MEKRNTNNCLHVDQSLRKSTKVNKSRINKSKFSSHKLVIKRKEKQNKRNVKHDDVSSISIEVIKTVFLYIFFFIKKF